MKLQPNHPLDNFDLVGSSSADRFEPDGSGERMMVDAYVWFDWDSYRWLDVLHKREDETDWWDLEDRVQLEYLGGTTRVLRSLVDTLPPDVLALDIGPSGEVEWTSTADEYNGAWCTYYPSVEEYGLPSSSSLPVLLRSDLTELDRVDGTVTKVSYRCPTSGQEKVGAFKAIANCPPYGGVWDEIQIMARLPPHPLILPIDSLVLEELTGLGVVGFTTPFVSAPSLDEPLSGPFKLRWLRELMGLVDELNLKYGVVHQSIFAQNLLINPDTDSILLFDFNAAAKIGEAPAGMKGPHNNYEQPELNDIKGVAFSLYCIITRDPEYLSARFDRIRDDEFDDLAKWTQHPQQINYPSPPSPPSDIIQPPTPQPKHAREWDAISTHEPIGSRLRAGRPVLNWQRPARDGVDKGRRLLATGRYADEQAEVEKGMAPIAVPDLKRRFPQPPPPPPGRVTRARARRVGGVDAGVGPSRVSEVGERKW